MTGRWTRGLTALTAVAAFGLVLAASAGTAWAHKNLQPVVAVEDLPAPAAETLLSTMASTPAAPAVPIWPALLLAFALGATLAAPRRARVLVLALLLLVLALETGVHSVHHLGDQQASHCVVALASAHVHGAAQPLAVHELMPPTVAGTVVAPESDRPGARPLRPDEGRAPPLA